MDEINSAFDALDGYDFKGFKTEELPEGVKDTITTDKVNKIATIKEKRSDISNYIDRTEPDTESLAEKYKEEGMPDEEIDKIIQEIITNELSVKFEFKELSSSDFF